MNGPVVHPVGRTGMLRCAVVLVVLLSSSLLPAFEAEATGTFKSLTKGLDSCAAPSVSQMRAFWNGTPYWQWYIYVGGDMRACSQANLTSSWISQVGPNGIGWGLVPVWVGPQAPCTNYRVRFSYNTTDAYNQGRAEAFKAVTAVVNLGMGWDVPIVYDLEGYNTSDSACGAAAKSFVQGWVDYLAIPPAQTSGVYGSSCASGLNNFATIRRPPDFIWGAWWNNNPSTSNLACVNAGYWVNRQRHKQYRGGHDETWNGVTLNVDSDCANGPVWLNFDRIYDSACA